MNLKVDFIENEIQISKDFITSVEIENKKYFYRFVKALYDIYNNNYSEEIHFFKEYKETSCQNIIILNDYFNIDLSSKKYITELHKNIINSIDEKNNQDISMCLKKLYGLFNKVLYNIDLPLEIAQEYNLEMILKLMKVSIKQSDELLENLFLIVDIERVLSLNRIIFFIDLKQYLSKEELNELYKYSIYNGIIIFLIDNRTYGVCLNNEKKLIIDENLDEFML